MILPSRVEVKEKYINYTDKSLKQIENKYLNLSNGIKIKQIHGINMMIKNEQITRNSNLFNESYYQSSSIEGCLHDIGRFAQYYLIGSLSDFDLKNKTGYNDHGKLGKRLLELDNSKLLRYFLPCKSQYDDVIKNVVSEHTYITNKNYNIDISNTINLFNNISFEDSLKNNDLRNKLIALKILLLQESDSLEIFYNIKKGLWDPKISSDKNEFVTDEVFNDFINFNDINISKYKNFWTTNCGVLLRYSLILKKINLISTLKEIQNENLIDIILNKNNDILDKKLLFSNIFINEAIQDLIDCSEDGVFINNNTRLKAKEKALKKFNLWRNI